MRVANAMEGVATQMRLLRFILPPAQILVALSLEFAYELKTTDIELKIAELDRRVRHLHPTVIGAVREAAKVQAGSKTPIGRRYGQCDKFGWSGVCYTKMSLPIRSRGPGVLVPLPVLLLIVPSSHTGFKQFRLP